ncbi:MAG: hypothetical protein K6L76_06150 [Agarilytica sp.]
MNNDEKTVSINLALPTRQRFLIMLPAIICGGTIFIFALIGRWTFYQVGLLYLFEFILWYLFNLAKIPLAETFDPQQYKTKSLLLAKTRAFGMAMLLPLFFLGIYSLALFSKKPLNIDALLLSFLLPISVCLTLYNQTLMFSRLKKLGAYKKLSGVEHLTFPVFHILVVLLVIALLLALEVDGTTGYTPAMFVVALAFLTIWDISVSLANHDAIVSRLNTKI